MTKALTWKNPRRIFVNSMSDLFHADVPDNFIHAVFTTMVAADRHVFQVLTKRPQRLIRLAPFLPWPEHIWIGVSIESDDVVWRADYLRQVPAAVRFVSAEPLLGPLQRLNLDSIDWLITGGESGPRHRPCNEEWVSDLCDRCVRAGVAFFLKQWGGRTPKAEGAAYWTAERGTNYLDQPTGQSRRRSHEYTRRRQADRARRSLVGGKA